MFVKQGRCVCFLNRNIGPFTSHVIWERSYRIFSLTKERILSDLLFQGRHSIPVLKNELCMKIIHNKPWLINQWRWLLLWKNKECIIKTPSFICVLGIRLGCVKSFDCLFEAGPYLSSKWTHVLKVRVIWTALELQEWMAVGKQLLLLKKNQKKPCYWQNPQSRKIKRSWQSSYAIVPVIGEPKYLSWSVPNENKLSTVVQ